MRRATVAFTLVLVLLAPGCLGSVSPATIPTPVLQDNNWLERNRDEQGVAGGLGTVVLIDYGPAGTYSGLGAGITAATANDVPIVNEERFIPMALERIEEQRGVQFENPRPRTVQLTNVGTSVTGTEYDITGAPTQGRGLVFTVDCDDFVVVAAYGAMIEGGGRLLGGGSDENLYETATRIARTVVC